MKIELGSVSCLSEGQDGGEDDDETEAEPVPCFMEALHVFGTMRVSPMKTHVFTTRVLNRKCLASDASLLLRVKNRRLIGDADWLAVRAKPSLSTVRPHVQDTEQELLNNEEIIRNASTLVRVNDGNHCVCGQSPWIVLVIIQQHYSFVPPAQLAAHGLDEFRGSGFDLVETLWF
uniref:Uncharacterized protein n=1 Tax=Timema bartmani TaxID=61472 RepID=A0A7R9EXH5_9NEOP|nr:unnamed protein product [Timema bartmani]